jgi:hypothetical protein
VHYILSHSLTRNVPLDVKTMSTILQKVSPKTTIGSVRNALKDRSCVEALKEYRPPKYRHHEEKCPLQHNIDERLQGQVLAAMKDPVRDAEKSMGPDMRTLDRVILEQSRSLSVAANAAALNRKFGLNYTHRQVENRLRRLRRTLKSKNQCVPKAMSLHDKAVQALESLEGSNTAQAIARHIGNVTVVSLRGMLSSAPCFQNESGEKPYIWSHDEGCRKGHEMDEQLRRA